MGIMSWPKWGFLGAWFFLILATTSSIMPLSDLAVTHRMYLPMAALATGVVVGGYLAGKWLVRPGRIVSPLRLQVIGVALVLFAGIAHRSGDLSAERGFSERSVDLGGHGGEETE